MIGVDIEFPMLHPHVMSDGNGVIEKNLTPFKLSDFRKKYRLVIDKF